MNMQKISEIIATVFYIGRAPFAPGTFGSLPAFAICYLIMRITLTNGILFEFADFNIYEQKVLTILAVEFVALLVIFIIGTAATHVYIKDKPNKDPKEVVIDEVAGQMLTIILCAFSTLSIYFTPVSEQFSPYFDWIFMFLLPFVLFRMFDILKPWPINWIDSKCEGAFAVMIDDILAAIFAFVGHYVLAAILLELYI